MMGHEAAMFLKRIADLLSAMQMGNRLWLGDGMDTD